MKEKNDAYTEVLTYIALILDSHFSNFSVQNINNCFSISLNDKKQE